MIEKEAINKYGKENWKKMQNHLIGITTGVAANGEHDFYEDDLDLAFKALKGKIMTDWD